MDNFSKEYLFKQCNINRHCLCLNLTKPVCLNDKLHDSIYLISVDFTEEEEALVLTNIKEGENSYGEMTISFFIDNQTPLDIVQGTINTNNIYNIESIKP